MTHLCPVCGYPGLAEPPRRRNGSGSYEICPSCCFQFGVSDDDYSHTYESWRAAWQKSGMKWSKRGGTPPPGWNPQDQLAAIAASVAPPRKRKTRPEPDRPTRRRVTAGPPARSR